MTIPLSVLDLAPITEGADASVALRNTLDLAQHAERWGYRRFWLAEHHGIPGIASAATSIVIAHVAGGTTSIRVGSGGVMLPNHAPLVIAEQFGTLESLFPGRIDLGLGRAPGSDQRTMRALRRSPMSAESFPQDVVELQAYFRGDGDGVRAIPGAGLSVPIWLLGSSLFSARLAAALGLPFAFASHFAPTALARAIALYRAEFRPSDALDRPYVMLGLNVVAAETDAEAARLFTSLQQRFLSLRRGEPGGALPPPIDSMEGRWSLDERELVEEALACSAVGSPATVRDGIERFAARHAPDELMITAQIFDHAARLRSYEIAAQLGER